MPLEPAISAAFALRDALTAEVARSQAARAVLRAMRSDALFEFALQREAFNATSGALSAALASAISKVATSQNKVDVSMTELEHLWPAEAQTLGAALGEIRSLSAALKELDALHQDLAGRALTFVRAYVAQLSPRPAAYNRRGQNAASAHDHATRSERA